MYLCVRCNQFYKSMAEVKACNHKPKQIEAVKEELITEANDTITGDTPVITEAPKPKRKKAE